MHIFFSTSHNPFIFFGNIPLICSKDFRKYLVFTSLAANARSTIELPVKAACKRETMRCNPNQSMLLDTYIDIYICCLLRSYYIHVMISATSIFKLTFKAAQKNCVASLLISIRHKEAVIHLCNKAQHIYYSSLK